MPKPLGKSFDKSKLTAEQRLELHLYHYDYVTYSWVRGKDNKMVEQQEYALRCNTDLGQWESRAERLDNHSFVSHKANCRTQECIEGRASIFDNELGDVKNDPKGLRKNFRSQGFPLTQDTPLRRNANSRIMSISVRMGCEGITHRASIWIRIPPTQKSI